MAVVGWLGALHSVDFPVYYRSAQNFFSGHAPVYGPRSGLGWPMYYRYPPLFLFLFYPLLGLRSAWAAGIWAAGKVALLFWVVDRLRQPWRGTPDNAGESAFRRRLRHWRLAIIPLLISATYLLVEFRYGNVQFYIFGLTAFGLLESRRRPWLAALALGLAISVKIWPLFFLPFLWVRGARGSAAGALLAAAGLTLLPGALWSWHSNLALLAQWSRQEWGTAVEAGKLWYPNQSLRGLLTRYLHGALIPGYPSVACAHWPAKMVRNLWLALDGALYASWLWLATRKPGRVSADCVPSAAPLLTACQYELLLAGLGWSLLGPLAPFTHIEDLCVLLWPAMLAAALLAGGQARSAARHLLWAAALLAATLPLIPGSAAQRWLQAAGADFLVAALLALALAMVAGRVSRPMPLFAETRQ